MSKRLDAKQQRMLSELEAGKKSVDVILQDHPVPPDEFSEWLKGGPFMRALEAMRQRMDFKLEQELCRGAATASERIANAVNGNGGFAKMVDLQTAINAIRLCQAIVRTPALKRRMAAIVKRAAKKCYEAEPSLGYHPSNTPERAAALLAKLMRREERDACPDRDLDENGHWMPAD